jgi:hypothetical protein
MKRKGKTNEEEGENKVKKEKRRNDRTESEAKE